MEKEHQPDSMATINMKPEYPPSEVYSASEPPPAYRQGSSNSVQIARIIALTVVASSLILGSFILASSWVSARASCHQLEQLDAMLDKELALEGRAYGNDALLPDEPLPVNNAHALHAPPPPALLAQDAPVHPEAQHKEDALTQAESKLDEDKLQKIDDTPKKDAASDSDESSESDSSSEDDDDLEALRPMLKLPVQFDLDELAGAFLANSQKGRMNCVVERRNEDPMERRFPFNIMGVFAPRPAQGERIAIICHGGDEASRPMVPEPQSQVFAFPLSGPVRLPLRPTPERDAPADRMLPFPPMPQRRPFPMPMPWDSSEEQMIPPREMRIHVQRVITIPHGLPAQEPAGPFAPPPPPQEAHDQTEQQDVMHQFVPQPAPTQDMDQNEQEQKMNNMPMGLPWGLTPEDIQAIQRSAEDAAQRSEQQQQIDNDMEEVKTIVNTLAAAAAEAEAEAAARRAQPAPEAPRAPRTLLLPQDAPAEERPHYVQPRSVRSVDSMLHRQHRVKRCACDCA